MCASGRRGANDAAPPAQDELLLVASDGLWDAIDPQESVDFLRHQLLVRKSSMNEAVQALGREACERSSHPDNIAAVCVALNLSR